MHRVTSTYVSLKRFPSLSNYGLKSKSEVQPNCQFCYQVHLVSYIKDNGVSVRHHSTKTDNALETLKKKPKAKRKKNKNYIELMAVKNDSSLKLMKVSIRNINAVNFCQLASSNIPSIGQLHKITTPNIEKEIQDSIRNKDIKNPTAKVKLKEKIVDNVKTNINLDYDKHNLIYTNKDQSTLKEKLKEKHYIDVIKESYYNFRNSKQGERNKIKPNIKSHDKKHILSTPNTTKENWDICDTKTYNSEIKLEDDNYVLIYTNSESTTSSMLERKQYMDALKESYYSFRKETLYEQRLQDFQYAINEGFKQGFDSETELLLKSPHAAFTDLFTAFDNSSENNKKIKDTELQRLNQPQLDFEDPSLDSVLREEIKYENEFNVVKELVDEDISKLEVKQLENEKEKRANTKKMRTKRHALLERDMKTSKKELNKDTAQKSLQLLVGAHIQLLCSLQMFPQAKRVLQHFKHKNDTMPESPKINDISICNNLLHGYASKGLLEDAQDLLSLISTCGLELNAQSYAALFECVERSQVPDKLSVLNSYLKQMQEKGLTLNDLMDKSKFVYDQRETVLNAIRRVEPNFEPQYTPPELDYDCPLLDKLKLHNVENRLGLLKSPSDGLLTLEDLRTKAKEQLEMEYAGEVEIDNVAVKKTDCNNELNNCKSEYDKKLKEVMECTRKNIRESFICHLSALKLRSAVTRSPIRDIYPYFKVLEVDQYVELILNQITNLVDTGETYSPLLYVLQYQLGLQVYQKYQQAQYRRNGYLENLERVYEEYCKWYLDRRAVDGSATPLNNRQAWQMLVHKHRSGASLDFNETPWSRAICNNIGKFLYDIIINDLKINVNLFKKKAKVTMMPMVYKVHRNAERKVHLELKPHPVLARLFSATERPTLNIKAELAPTRVPPVPWVTAGARGAFFVTTAPIIRLPFKVNAPQKKLEEAPPVQLYPVLDSLNHLAEVPWVINKRILDLQLEIFRAGGDKKLDIAQPASAVDIGAVLTGLGDGATNASRARIAIKRAKAEMHSLWCDALYKLSLANHYRDTVFWLPQNIDFRGRVYAVGPHVSVLGDDMARALLTLARGRQLGPHGLRWLKLHAINLTGTRKRETLDQRLEYAESIIDKILDSADRPLDGEGWWKESEDPWQTLACCMEIANAMRSPNAAEYVCGLPIHQDGSCNGLQHYAALGADAAGAAAVNLTPADQPQDVYSEVAALVEKARAEDAANGHSIAVALEGCLRRKVVKQTVMTTVYGVTRFGARLQIAKQLKDIEELPKDLVWRASHYVTVKTFASLAEMFTSTRLIQEWLTECANLISGVCGESVEWVTPLGLPVMQPYYKHAQSVGMVPLDFILRPCTMKQRNGFPPNFIHSLDSTHMMLTTLHCVAAGVTFVSVHDCFWTHPHTVDAMNKICREQFVALYLQDILKDLSQYMVKKYSYTEEEIKNSAKGTSNKKQVNAVLQKVPPKGSFNIKNVLNSTYFFS